MSFFSDRMISPRRELIGRFSGPMVYKFLRALTYVLHFRATSPISDGFFDPFSLAGGGE